MLTELQRKRVWEGWWTSLFLSSGAVASVIIRLPQEFSWVAPVLALLGSALTLYSLIAQNQKHATDSADLHLRWTRLASEFQRLWDDMYADDAPARLAVLEEREAELGRAGTAFPVNEKRLLKWQDHVEKHNAARA
jgi:hypothetical protein